MAISGRAAAAISCALFLLFALIAMHPATVAARGGTLCLVYNNPSYVCTALASPSPTPTPTGTPTATPAPTPTPTPTPLVANGPPFSAPSNYPNVAFQPYSHATSNPWNTAAAVAASVNASSSTWQTYYNGSTTMFNPAMQFGYTNQVNEFKHPIYFGNTGDPLYTINSGTCPDGYGDCSGSFHAPTYMQAAGGTDHHMTVVDWTTNEERDLYAVTGVNNTTHVITAGNADKGNVITGSGLFGEQTRAGFFLWAGAIRQQEFVAAATTGAEVPHALFLTAPCTSNVFQYPSVTFGPTDTLCTSSQGAPYGGWLRLNMTESAIAATGAPQWAKGLMRTLRDYGGFIGDTNNNNGFNALPEPDIMYSLAGYTNASCPTTSPATGIPCSPMTAWEHGSNADADWTGNRYSLNLATWVPSSAWQWVDNPPGHP